MIHGEYPVDSVREVRPGIFTLRFRSPLVAASVRPGQFLNIRATTGFIPLLRRPFSVYRTEGEHVEIIFNVIGQGTSILARKTSADTIDVLGPLGNAFGTDAGFETALLVAGGLGVAPMPILTAFLRRSGKRIATYLGARTGSWVVTDHLDNVSVATDDGSAGSRGTVVDILERSLANGDHPAPKIFACGPTPMLRSLSAFAVRRGLRCEVSLESPMACGVGICQGCPVELNDGERKYALVCRDGTVFDAGAVTL
jgi:dihydroorotate dehydrogenase electron transfer subunit